MENELVIFDLGNVIVRNIEMLKTVAAGLGVDCGRLEADYRKYENAMMAGLISVQDYYRRLEHIFSVQLHDDVFRTAFRPVINAPVLELADRLRAKGQRCVIGSNTFSSHWPFIDEMGIRSHFDDAYASHEIHAVKPYEAFFALIMFREGFPAERTHFIDDSPANVAAAAAMGIDAYCYDDDDAALFRHFSCLI